MSSNNILPLVKSLSCDLYGMLLSNDNKFLLTERVWPQKSKEARVSETRRGGLCDLREPLCYHVGPFQLWGQAGQLSLATMGSTLCTCYLQLSFLSLLCVDICNASAPAKESSSAPSSATGTAGIW